MNHFYTYGTKESSFKTLKENIAQLFNVELTEHESGWWGVYAKGETPQIKEIKLYPNFVEGEGLHVDEGGFIYLLSISFPENPTEIPGLISSGKSNFNLLGTMHCKTHNKAVKHRSASLHWTEFKSQLCGFAAQKYSTKL